MNNNWAKSTFPLLAVVGIFASPASADYPTDSVGTNTSTTTLHNVACAESLHLDGQRLLVGFAYDSLNFIGFNCVWPDNTAQYWVGQYTDSPREAWCPDDAPFMVGLRGYLGWVNPSYTFFTGLGPVCAGINGYPPLWQQGDVARAPLAPPRGAGESYFRVSCANGNWMSGVKAFVENGKHHVIRRLAARCTP